MAHAATYDKNVLIHDQRVLGQTPDYLAKPSNIIWTDADTPLDWIMHTVSVKASETADGKLVNLYLIGHGAYTKKSVFENIDEGYGKSRNAFVGFCGAYYGGMGIVIGKEHINANTLNTLDKIKNKIGKIICYSCGAAGGKGALISSKTIEKNTLQRAYDWAFNKKPFSEKEYTIVEANEDSVVVQRADDSCSAYTQLQASDRLRGVQFRFLSQLPSKHELMSAICKNTGAVVIAADQTQRYKSTTEMIDMQEWEGQLYQYDPPNGNPTAIFRPGNDYF